ncbi:hypothetical protein CEF21_18565 [Bacillus sp. FJAT-42376]|nr:hypothetical protein CEF21_18565 [Bacillus sp. FJAT-42376]
MNIPFFWLTKDFIEEPPEIRIEAFLPASWQVRAGLGKYFPVFVFFIILINRANEKQGFDRK